MTRQLNLKLLNFSWYLATHVDEIQVEGATNVDIAQHLYEVIEKSWWPAWKNHPDYRPSDEDIHNPTVVSVYKHKPFQGHTESYVIGDVQYALSPAGLRWGKRTLGDFVGIRPILPEFPVHPTRISFISWSLKGSGNAFQCRQILKSYLPRNTHTLLTQARRIWRQPKYSHLAHYQLKWSETHRNQHFTKEHYPDWYKKKTKYDLHYEKFVNMAETQYPEQWERVKRFIKPQNFWMIAIGKCDPEDVPKYVTHQLELPIIN